MRVAYVSSTPSIDTGHLTQLNRNEHVLLLVGDKHSNPAFYTVQPVDIPHISLRTIRFRSNLVWWYLRGLTGALQEFRPDIVHVQNEPWSLTAIQCSIFASRSGAALVINGCERLWDQGGFFERRIRHFVASRVLRRTAAFLAESEEPLSIAMDRGLGSSSFTAVVHTNPRDPRIFHPPDSPDEQRRSRSNFGLPREGIGIGFVGRLVQQKGIGLLIEALPSVVGPGVWAAIVGMGPLQENVTTFAATTEDIFYLGQLDYPQEMARFLQSIDILAVPSYTTSDTEEQGPRVVIEAGLTGCLIVASEVGSIPWMLGSDSILVTPRSSAALVQGLTEALVQVRDSKRERVALKRIETFFSSDSVAPRLWSIWHSAVRENVKEK